MPSFITIDAAGTLTGLYIDKDAGPNGAIEVTTAFALDFSDKEQAYHYDVTTGTLVADPVVLPTAAELLVYAAAARYAKEIGGIKVGTAQVDTSRESQSMVANAYAFMQQSGAASTQYKTDSGWVTVTADQMKAIALAVGAHVQACFAVEADLDAKITVGTVTTTAQIDAAFAALTI